MTALTASRLQATLALAERERAAFVALQETRHPAGGFPWARRLASDAGFHICWSAPPPPLPNGARAQGGTALLWRRGGDRSGPLMPSEGGDPELRHRMIGRLFADVAVVSAYGPAASPDLGWLCDTARTVGAAGRPAVIVGDLNWRACYDVLDADGWHQLLPAIPTVIDGEGAPTRCLVLGGVVRRSHAVPLEGVPHHAAVCYSVAVPGGTWQPVTRLRRTARYEWGQADAEGAAQPVSPAGDEHRQRVLRAAADQVGRLDDADLATPTAWQLWHRRAEAVCQEAVRRGWASCTRQAERAKGSAPTARPIGGCSAIRLAEPIALRRLRRLHRCAAEQWRHHGGSHPLTARQRRRWGRAVAEGLADSTPATQSEAVATATAAISARTAALQREESRRWRARLAEWSPDAARAARPVMHGPEPPGHFGAGDMRTEWAAWWCRPRAEETAGAWRDAADAAQFQPLPATAWTPPSRRAFGEAIAATRGAGGLDGWESGELRALNTEAPFVVDELHGLLLALTQAAADPAVDLDSFSIFWWRVVGIPKRGSDASRPIAIGSVALRAWHRALLPMLPEVEPPQFGGRAGHSAASATVDWLSAPGAAGAEVDLEKAFDSVQHPAAAAALRHRGAPDVVVRFLERGAWRGRRYCHVSGELATSLRPTAGIPAGDPASPAVLAALLSPWPAVVAEAAAVDTWLFVDDRSLKVRDGVESPADELARALAATQRFDAAIGVRENARKRQEWAGAEDCEHLGLRVQGCCGAAATADAADPEALPRPFREPVPRDGWTPVSTAIARMAMVPAAQHVRECLAATFVLTKWLWSAPLAPMPPASIVQRLGDAILRTNCTWWCRARFWAERIGLHPRYGTVLRNLGAAEKHHAWRAPCVQHTMRRQTALIDLEVVAYGETGLWLAPAAAADARVTAAAATAAVEAARDAARECAAVPACPDGRPVFRPALPAGAHAARVAARVVCLAGARPQRHDVEGLDRADVELLSHPRWKRWTRSLAPQRALALRVWRGGAVLTPTRRWYQRVEAWSACPWCDHPRASARHFFAECPRLDRVRAWLSEAHGLPAGWWAAQPRAVAKTGWMPVGSSIDEALAANAMGMAIVDLAPELRAAWRPALPP